MGGNISKGSDNTSKYIDDDRSIGFEVQNYSNEEDELFKVCEEKLNILQYFSLNSFQQLVYTAFETKDCFADNIIDTSLIIFTSRKLVKHELVSNEVRINDQLNSEIKFFYENVYSELLKKYRHYYKKSVEENQKKKVNLLSALSLLTIGFNYCKVDNFSKVEFIFNLLSEDGKVLKKSHYLRLFVMFVLLVPSNIMIVMVDKLSESFEKYKVSLETIQKYFSAFEYEDCLRLTEMTLESMFGGNEEVNFTDFCKNFKNCDYLLTVKGIRNKLKSTNVNN